VTLTERYGADHAEPTEGQLIQALQELFEENTDDEEHPDAWLRHGDDDGPMCVLTFTRARAARFEEWADQDYRVELVAPREAVVPDKAVALELWKRLAAGDLQAVRDWFQSHAATR